MKVLLETFGCQMNELDSELVTSHLEVRGYSFTNDLDDADIVLYNTCSVREQAENKAFSRIGLIGRRKEAGQQIILGVIGCMAERDGTDMMRRHPQVDLLCGPGELDRLPMLIDNAMADGIVNRSDTVALAGNRHRRSATLAAAEDDLEMLDRRRVFNPDRDEAFAGRSAYVRITRGCNKFCTYCVVPYTRGAEIHRPPDSIIQECRELADKGVVEVTLIGQTVNHYRYTHGTTISISGTPTAQVGPGLSAFRKPLDSATERVTSFADLLHAIHEQVPQIQRLRFVTSYPRDFTDDILTVMSENHRICRYLHVPAQSGSDRILKLMNRGYSVSEYLEFIDRATSMLEDVSIAGDIIVGFPTETDQDHEATRALLKRVPFKNNFIFKYSPRPGTTAYDRLPDDVPNEVKKARNNDLLSLQSAISKRAHDRWVGREVEVFVERAGKRAREKQDGTQAGTVELKWMTRNEPDQTAPWQLSGRTPGDLITVFDVDQADDPMSMVGSILPVRIESSGPLLLRGRILDRSLKSCNLT